LAKPCKPVENHPTFVVNLQTPVGGGRQTMTQGTSGVYSNGLATGIIWKPFYCITSTRKIGTIHITTVIPTISLSSVITTISVPLM
jgi:hypothetical protein